jgi:hypothetical protein
LPPIPNPPQRILPWLGAGYPQSMGIPYGISASAVAKKPKKSLSGYLVW